MKQTYEAPVLEIEEFETEDVLLISVDKTNTGTFTTITWDSLS